MYSEEQLSIFVKVVESGSFSKVAIELGRSQSAVSIAIRNLEEALGYRVFDRIGKRFQLNSQGEQLYQLCQRRVAALSRLHKIADNLHHAIESEVAIYIDHEVDPLPLAALLEKFHCCFPSTQIVTQKTWQSASFLIVPEDRLVDENAKNGWNWLPYSEETLLPVSGPAESQHTQYIEVPWGPKSPTRHHLMTSKPTTALQMVLGNMGWCWIPRFLLAQYQCGLDYKEITKKEPMTRRYVLGVSKQKGPALQWLSEQALAGQGGD